MAEDFLVEAPGVRKVEYLNDSKDRKFVFERHSGSYKVDVIEFSVKLGGRWFEMLNCINTPEQQNISIFTIPDKSMYGEQQLMYQATGDGKLVRASYPSRDRIDDHDARMKAAGFMTVEELPKEIDIKATFHRLADQIREKDFSIPQLVPKGTMLE
ncbi:MAG TPA: hypothetical protein VG895_05395 [Patescibacteria group bacterium]|nr:hypothetical protein [Patescibacteria group bacterium]